MKNITRVFVTAMFISGCGNMSRSVDASVGAAMKGKIVAHTVRKIPVFRIMTPEDAILKVNDPFGFRAGRAVIVENRVTDPTDTIASELLAAVVARHGAVAAPQAVAVDFIEPAKIVAAANDQAAYVLDVQTQIWHFGYAALNWNRYHVFYIGNVRLIDAANNQVVGEGNCQWSSQDKENKPTYDELLADNASRLKRENAAAASACLVALKAQMAL